MYTTINEQKVLQYLIKQAKKEWNEIYFKGLEKAANIDRVTAYKTLKALGDANEIIIKMVENEKNANYFKWYFSLPITTKTIAKVEDTVEEVKTEQVAVVDDADAIETFTKFAKWANKKHNEEVADMVVERLTNMDDSKTIYKTTDDEECFDCIMNDAKAIFNKNIKHTLAMRAERYRDSLTPQTMYSIINEECKYNLDYNYIQEKMVV